MGLRRGDDGRVEGPYAAGHDVSDRESYLSLVYRLGTTPNGVFGAKIHWNTLRWALAKFSEMPRFAGQDRGAILRTAIMNVASGTLRPLNGHRHTLSAMTEEWRVSLVIYDDGSIFRRSRFRDLLRSRLGDDVTISVGQMHIFLYTGSAKAADEAGQVARALLEEQGRRLAEIRLECWDPADTEWRDPEAPEKPAEHEDKPGPGRLETTAAAFVKGVGQALQWGSP